MSWMPLSWRISVLLQRENCYHTVVEIMCNVLDHPVNDTFEDYLNYKNINVLKNCITTVLIIISLKLFILK